MNKFLKILYILSMIVGILLFISLYILVCILKENQFKYLKEVVMITGYTSIILFMTGFLLTIKKRKE